MSVPSKKPRKVTVLGDGGWGTALAVLLHDNGHTVTLWGNFPDYVEHLKRTRCNSKFLPDIRLPDEIDITASADEALDEAEMAVAAVPVVYLRSVMEKVKPAFSRGIPIVSVAKGIENDTLLTARLVIRDVLGEVKVGVLSGPSHCEEVARGLPTTVVAASEDLDYAEEIQMTFMTERFRVYTNEDVVGVELGGALKNVIAIASGICEGLGFGDNSKAALISRGLAEMSRLGVAMGARASTFAGLSGLGDLITTCISPYGRNRAVGLAIGKGKRLDEILRSMSQVAEGVWTAKSACALAERHGVEMPITREVFRILFENKDPRRAVSDLMTREPRRELDSY